MTFNPNSSAIVSESNQSQSNTPDKQSNTVSDITSDVTNFDESQQKSIRIHGFTIDLIYRQEGVDRNERLRQYLHNLKQAEES